MVGFSTRNMSVDPRDLLHGVCLRLPLGKGKQEKRNGGKPWKKGG